MRVVGNFDKTQVYSLNCLQECLKAAGTPLANDFCLRRDDAGNAVLFMRNNDEYLAVAVSEKYPNMAVRSIVNALINVSPNNKVDCTQNKHPTLCLATGSFEQASRYEMLGWQCVSIALYQPSKWHGKIESAFAASKELLRDLQAHKVSINDYRARYISETLDKVDLDAVLAKYDGKVVFLTYTKVGYGFDYRHFLGDALITAGYPCYEIQDSQIIYARRDTNWRGK